MKEQQENIVIFDQNASLGVKIRQLLNDAGDDLRPELVARLRLARERAAAHYAGGEEFILSLATREVGHCSESPGAGWRPWLSWVLPILILVAILSGIDEWQQSQQINEMADIDTMILTDDMPLHVHLDAGFSAVLQHD